MYFSTPTILPKQKIGKKNVYFQRPIFHYLKKK